MPNYNGHAPSHVRRTFLDAIDAFVDWEDGAPEPKVEFEAKFDTRQISISEACGLVWNCTDILPSDARSALGYADITLQTSWTYAAAAHAMLASIKKGSRSQEVAA